MPRLRIKEGQILYLSAWTVPGLEKDRHFTLDEPEHDFTDEEAALLKASHRGDLFNPVEDARERDDEDDKPNKEELQARYKDLSGEDPDKRWSVKKLAEAIADLEAAANTATDEPSKSDETEGVE